jgi:hypothetical protein
MIWKYAVQWTGNRTTHLVCKEGDYQMWHVKFVKNRVVFTA